MSVAIRAVFDANVFVQAVLSGTGPAALCFDVVRDGLVELFATPLILEEAEDALRRLAQKPKFSTRLPNEAITAFFSEIHLYVTVAPEPPHVWDLPRDPDDEVYLDLAISLGVVFLTTRDRDLLSLTDDGEFRSRYPGVTIVTATEFLRHVVTR